MLIRSAFPGTNGSKAQRFCSEFVIQMDATFSTNQLDMPLANIVGVDNHERTFTVALSFIRAEHAEDFTFILQCLEELVFFTQLRCPVLCSLIRRLVCAKLGITESPRWKSIYHRVIPVEVSASM
jgi:hypothetical protein